MSETNRKQSYVDSQVQGALVRRVILHWVGFFVSASLGAFVLQFLSNPFQPISVHLQNLWWTQGPFMVVMAFLLPVFVLDTIKFSNRFAGPILRLRGSIRSIADGNPPLQLVFRKGDFWGDVAEDFNQMIARLTHDAQVTVEEPTEEDATQLCQSNS
jgi:methyl-accepting chemotaxis protein